MSAGGGHKVHRAVAAARALRGQTQAELARALTDATGSPWTRGMVANLESGRRSIDVDLLLAIAAIQDMPAEFYLYGPGRAVEHSSATRPKLKSPDQGALVGAAA